MKKAVLNLVDNKVVSVLYVADPESLPASENHLLIDLDTIPFNPHNGAIINSELVDVGEQPPYHVWDKNNNSWVPNLSWAKEVKLQQLNSEKLNKEYSGFTWNGKIFDSDQISQQHLILAAQQAGLAISNNTYFLKTWTLADNTEYTLSPQEMLEVLQALDAHVESVHIKAQALRVQLSAATTLEEVAAITWS